VDGAVDEAGDRAEDDPVERAEEWIGEAHGAVIYCGPYRKTSLPRSTPPPRP
jgi:hypothetical protein